ncbi:hypothetical protein BO86DRAFT_30729 [Aspergillus japonicus CBS 114.51]|uniref:Uncharacterized protein n=1 Tax=Aspergillus japonicus CBS 114.51 TaxID=1448312 RepID=A0A8T8WK49_ASPJA|nr:hypothetical protein BO86DRAFT_30729 [Aspergillus japonicus CBS 114.51]RAH76064.1 hypothetical protein BO86DRAFT_30729 [Aspergillus japonicus CBS 114.51]
MAFHFHNLPSAPPPKDTQRAKRLLPKGVAGWAYTFLPSYLRVRRKPFSLQEVCLRGLPARSFSCVSVPFCVLKNNSPFKAGTPPPPPPRSLVVPEQQNRARRRCHFPLVLFLLLLQKINSDRNNRRLPRGSQQRESIPPSAVAVTVGAQDRSLSPGRSYGDEGMGPRCNLFLSLERMLNCFFLPRYRQIRPSGAGRRGRRAPDGSDPLFP